MINEEIVIIDEKRDRQKIDAKINMCMLYDNWLNLIDEGRTIDEYFLKRGIHTVAIYGMGVVGNHLKRQLLNNGMIRVLYTIDRTTIECNSEKLDIERINELDHPEAIVVTPIMEFQSIQESLQRRIDCPIISIEEVIMEV